MSHTPRVDLPPTRMMLASLLVFGLAACGGGGDQQSGASTTDTTAADTTTTSTTPGSTAAPMDSGSMAAGAALSDAQIAGVLSASDSAEINPSQLAMQKAQNAQVRAFAQQMVKDHGMLEDSLHAMAQQQNMTPATSPLSSQVQTAAQATMQSLQGASGAAFDRAYMDAMVQSHQMALNAVDTQLLPAAQNPQLKTALQQKVRPAVASHLQHAQQIQGSLGH
ncbi:MAG: DUF4142 domain-containing protein [Gemmatimonadetes bacterium]|nr:DUF4142 domain-containing protein [Gemmatimonadota bacterium]